MGGGGGKEHPGSCPACYKAPLRRAVYIDLSGKPLAWNPADRVWITKNASGTGFRSGPPAPA